LTISILATVTTLLTDMAAGMAAAADEGDTVGACAVSDGISEMAGSANVSILLFMIIFRMNVSQTY
jgi:hypothetical protein